MGMSAGRNGSTPVIMALVQVPSGYLADHVGARLLMRAASILGIGCALTMAAAQTRPVFIAGILAYGFTSFIVAPLNSYITSQRGSWSVQRAITFISASMQAGAIAGPVLGGWIAEAAGLECRGRGHSSSEYCTHFVRLPAHGDAPLLTQLQHRRAGAEGLSPAPVTCGV